jgi:hypothetical protein
VPFVRPVTVMEADADAACANETQDVPLFVEYWTL